MKRIYSLLSLLLLLCSFTVAAQKKLPGEMDKCDPYMNAQGGYGYLIEDGAKAAVWWAEGIYKVMKATPVAKRKGREVKLSTARNEYESFIVVINPKEDLQMVSITVEGFAGGNMAPTGGDGDSTPATGISATIRKVEYVTTYYTNDDYGWPGEWPDPLPLYDEPQDAPKGVNTSFWITLYTPEDQPTGTYKGSVTLKDDTGWSVNVPVSLKVRPFTLPTTPTLKSGFGLRFDHVIQYENLKTKEQQQESFENYMETYRDYRISPTYNPFLMTPQKETVTGIDWSGGTFDPNHHTSGRYSYCVSDNSPAVNSEAKAAEPFIAVNPAGTYLVAFNHRSDSPHRASVAVDFYDSDKNLLIYRTLWCHFEAGNAWKSDTLAVERVPQNAAFAAVRLFGAAAVTGGGTTGTTWYDDIRFLDQEGRELIRHGDFEPDIDRMHVTLDFTDFEKTAAKYYGEKPWFNGFHHSINHLMSFRGFPQGTPEHEKLLGEYLQQTEAEFDKLGLLDVGYIYWVDEPFPDAYPAIRATNALIKKYAPRLRPFIAEQFPWLVGNENDPRLDIIDVTDIFCVSWNCLDDHDKVNRVHTIPGKEVWTYLCTATRAPFFTNFIDHDGIDMRMWIWATRTLGLKGILIWRNNYWNAPSGLPEGMLQNPWEEPASFIYFDRESEKTSKIWGNGDGRLFYPNNRHPGEDRTTAYTGRPIPCVRLEILRDGIEDYEYLTLLEKKIPQMSASDARKASSLLTLPRSVFQDDDAIHSEKYYIKDPQYLLDRRAQIATLLEKYR